jgi:hypothetical protein
MQRPGKRQLAFEEGLCFMQLVINPSTVCVPCRLDNWKHYSNASNLKVLIKDLGSIVMSYNLRTAFL